MANAALKIETFADLEKLQKQMLTLVAHNPLLAPAQQKTQSDTREGLEMGDYADKYCLSEFA